MKYMVDEIGIVAIILVITLYIFVSSLIKYKKWAFMHESSAAIIFGAIVAFALNKISG
jgi:uncharacterized membrane protein